MALEEEVLVEVGVVEVSLNSLPCSNSKEGEEVVMMGVLHVLLVLDLMVDHHMEVIVVLEAEEDKVEVINNRV
eukprot:gene57928-77303_t